MSKEEAIVIATEYSLQGEIEYCIDVLGMSPEEALYEWDL